MPFRRWISKLVSFEEVGEEDAGGSVESHRTERSQASTDGIAEGERGAWVRDIVEIAWLDWLVLCTGGGCVFRLRVGFYLLF